MPGFVLRREGDTTNPIAVRPNGEQSTAGQLAYWRQDGKQTFLIALLGEGERLFNNETSAGGFHGEGFFDSIGWYRYRGTLLTPYDAATDTGDYIFHKGYETDPALGFSDPNQGRPHFFPELDFTWSGRPYVEVRLPENLSSDGTQDPTESEIRLRTTCVWDYDASGNRVGASPTFTSNNLRLLAFAARCVGIDVTSRFDWKSWVFCRDKCDAQIGWVLGGGNGLLGQYYDGVGLATLVRQRIDPTVNFVWGSTAPLASDRPVWTNVTGATVGDNAAWTKTAATGWSNSNADASMTIPNGSPGSIKAVIAGMTVLIGLAYAANAGLGGASGAAYEYSIQCNAGTNVATLRGTGGAILATGIPCQPGDEFGLSSDGTHITYLKNGVALSAPGAAAITGDLYASVNGFSSGAGISSATMSPAPAGLGSTFSVRWTGFFQPPKTDTYEFFVNANDGVRLWVNGTPIISDWTEGSVRERSGSIALTGGTMYSITLEYKDASGQAQIMLSYQSSTISKQPVPQEQLFSDSTVSGSGRTIPRFSADVVFANMPWPTALDLLMSRCPGIKLQYANGKVYFLWANDRSSVMRFVYETGIPFTVDAAANTVLCTAHGLTNGAIVRLRALDGTLPGGLARKTNYWVRDVTANNFKLSATNGGAVIDIVDAGRGTFTYTMRSNIVRGSVSAQRTDPTMKPNFLVIGFRNKDDEVFTQAYAEIDRADIRDLANGVLNQPDVLQIGVATQSEAERIGEAFIRKVSDRDIEVKLSGQKSAHTVALHDLIELVHPRGDWRWTSFAGHPNGPITLEVMEERWSSTITSANEKAFIARVWYPEYDDTAHGSLTKRPPGYIPSAFDPPPAVTSVTLAERVWALPDATYALAVDGSVQADTSYKFDQRLRVWWRKPDDERVFTATPATDVINLLTHDFPDWTPVAFTSTGTLPGGLDASKTYFVVGGITNTTNTFKVALRVGGAPVDITSTGSGVHSVASFKVLDTVLTPNTATLQAVFSVQGVVAGVHQFKIVSESTVQQKLAFELHPTWTINVAAPVDTILKIFDNIPPRDVDLGLGLTIGVARVTAGFWVGSTLERDRGYGYEVVARALEREATLGHTDPGHSFLPSSAGTLWFVKEGGADPVNATTGEITAGKNNYFVGREKLGVQTWTNMGGGLWQGTGLVRGLHFTDLFQSSHTAQEDVIQLDENVYFIPIERRDIGQALSFMALTYGQQTATPIVFTPRGDSIRPYEPSNLSAVRDGHGDWWINAISNARVSEKPASFIARIRRVSDGVLMRDIPITQGVTQALLFPYINTSGGAPAVVDRNNVYASATATLTTRAVISAQHCDGPGISIQAACSVEMGAVGARGVWRLELIPANTPPALPSDYAVSAQYFIQGLWNPSTNSTDLTFNDSHGTYLAAPSFLGPGPITIRIAMIGTEVRFYASTNPLMASPIAPFAIGKYPLVFPLRLRVTVTNGNSLAGLTRVENVTIGGLEDPSTIYALRQQQVDDGESTSGTGLSTFDVEMWEISPIAEIGQGFSSRKVF